METLTLIVEARGQAVAKETFFERVWKGAYVEEANLTQTVFLLRRALGKLPCGGDYIETLPRQGYRLSGRALETPAELVTSGATGQTPVIAAPGAASADAVACEQPADFSPPFQPSPPCLSVDSGGRTRAALPARIAYALLPAGAVLAGMVILAAALWILSPAWKPPRVLRSTRLTSDGVYKEVLAPLVVNDTRIFFTEIIDNTNYLAEVSPLGGMVSRNRMPAAGATAATSSSFHDGVLLNSTWEGASEVGLLLRFSSDAARKMGTLSPHSAAWSPSGQVLAFTLGRSLMLTDPSGSNVRELARFSDVPFLPSWSPDGRRIRFSRNAGGLDQSLWEIALTGGPARPVLPNSPHAHHACCGSWSADGRYFLYVVDSGAHSSIWVKREHFPLHLGDSSREYVLADGPLDYWRAPVFGQDGSHIYAVGEQARGELARYNSDTHTFVEAYESISADTVSFSRDGQWMAYSLFPEGTLWRSRVNGTEKLQLTLPGQLARFPQWAPDGKSIAFIAAAPGQLWSVKIISRDGGKPRTVLLDGSSQGVATFSPDGTHIAFGRTISYGVPTSAQRGITVLDLGTNRSTRLAGSDTLWSARWSPDGKYLAATTLDRKKLMLYDFAAQQWSELSSLGVNDLVWSKHGDFLFFDTYNGGEASIYKAAVATRRVEVLADLHRVQRTGFFGWRLSISPDDDILLLRQKGFVELYRLDVALP